MKQECEMLPKVQRKQVMRQRKEQLDKYQENKEIEFIEQLERNHEMFMNKAKERHRERLCLLEKQFLEQKHQLERGMETALWELEEAQLAEKHALLTQQFRDVFHLQR
jgi:STE20-like kinase